VSLKHILRKNVKRGKSRRRMVKGGDGVTFTVEGVAQQPGKGSK